MHRFPDVPPHLYRPVYDAINVLQEATAEHDPRQIFCMFSGGKDSLATTLLTTRLYPEAKVVHINTGIGIPQTREYVRRVASDRQWDFIEAHPPGKTYEDMIREYGFPGPAGHRFSYIWLKERALKKLVREYKQEWKDRILIVTGVRTAESTRRMGNVSPIIRKGAQVWTSPIHNWSGVQTRGFAQWMNEQQNPVSDILGMSGECLCGAFAKEGERDMIRRFFPEAYAEINRLEHIAADAGKPCEWGKRPKKGYKPIPPEHMPMCVGCQEHPDDATEPPFRT